MAELPVDLFHWLAAIAPIVVLLVLLVKYRWPAHVAAVVAMFAAAVVAVAVYMTPLFPLAVAAAKGVWDAVFILYVVWPALLMYLITQRAGALYAIRKGIQQFSTNDLFLVLAFGWVFVAFLQGITGFGAPIAIVAPLLLALGVKPIYAVAIPLIGHAWNNNYGTLAVGWYAADAVAPFQAPVETAVHTSLLHTIPIILGGFAIAWLYGRMPAVKHAWPMVLLLAVSQSIALLLVSIYSPFIAGFLAAAVGMAFLYPISRWGKYGEQHKPFERPAMAREMNAGAEVATDGGEPTPEEEEEEPEPLMGLVEALFPYIVLLVVAVIVAFPTVDEVLSQFEVGFPFPAVETGYLEHAAEDPYSPFAILTHPGTIILIGVIAGWLLYRRRGYYEDWRNIMETSPHIDEEPSFIHSLLKNGVPASLAIVILVVMATIMVDSGQIRVLALGISLVVGGTTYLFLSNGIGVLGAFMTGSNTASNIMFSPLHDEAAAALDLPQWTVLGAQMTGGAIGNAISPFNVVLGTGTVGIVGQEGDVLRKTIPWTLIVAVLVGILTVLISGFIFLEAV